MRGGGGDCAVSICHKDPRQKRPRKGLKDRDTWIHMNPGVKTYTFRTGVEYSFKEEFIKVG